MNYTILEELIIKSPKPVVIINPISDKLTISCNHQEFIMNGKLEYLIRKYPQYFPNPTVKIPELNESVTLRCYALHTVNGFSFFTHNDLNITIQSINYPTYDEKIRYTGTDSIRITTDLEKRIVKINTNEYEINTQKSPNTLNIYINQLKYENDIIPFNDLSDSLKDYIVPVEGDLSPIPYSNHIRFRKYSSTIVTAPSAEPVPVKERKFHRSIADHIVAWINELKNKFPELDIYSTDEKVNTKKHEHLKFKFSPSSPTQQNFLPVQVYRNPVYKTIQHIDILIDCEYWSNDIKLSYKRMYEYLSDRWIAGVTKCGDYTSCQWIHVLDDNVKTDILNLGLNVKQSNFNLRCRIYGVVLMDYDEDVPTGPLEKIGVVYAEKEKYSEVKVTPKVNTDVNLSSGVN